MVGCKFFLSVVDVIKLFLEDLPKIQISPQLKQQE